MEKPGIYFCRMEEAQLALNALREDPRLGLLKLRHANRQVQVALKYAKGATAQSRLQYDTAELARQAALFQRDQVLAEIEACRSIERLWEQLEIILPDEDQEEEVRHIAIKEALLQERQERESLKAQLERERSIRDAEAALLEARQREAQLLLEHVASLIKVGDSLKLTLRLTEERVKELVKGMAVAIEAAGETAFTLRNPTASLTLRQEGFAVILEQEENVKRTVAIEDLPELREAIEEVFISK